MPDDSPLMEDAPEGIDPLEYTEAPPPVPAPEKDKGGRPRGVTNADRYGGEEKGIGLLKAMRHVINKPKGADGKKSTNIYARTRAWFEQDPKGFLAKWDELENKDEDRRKAMVKAVKKDLGVEASLKLAERLLAKWKRSEPEDANAVLG